MTAYQNMMEQIALDEDTLREKAAQMQELSAHRTIRQHRTGKHHMLRLTAAAAAVLVFGTVTVGAVNGWDYKGIFTKYFSSKSEQAVDYDFTGMGLDLGDVIEGDGYTLTLDALLTDSRNVYIAYHYTGNYDCYTDVIYADIVTANSRPHEFLKYQGSCEPECDEDGIHHGILDVRLRNSDISLADKQLTLSVNGQKLTYPLSDITAQKGISIPYNGTLPNDLSETEFDKVDLTPLMMEFTKVVYDRHEGMLDFNEVFGENRVPVEITAVYADGSEKTVKPLESHDGAFESSTLQPDGSYRHELERPYYFASPVKLDGLTAMRINGTEIPIK